ncbi:prepilin peptidase-dependent protein [Enterobacter chuandaensis]|uniref:Prepilin peptidase-dependent protein n=1 Tax=Enterobacter chuandaensis TaxID=2497875 RepID=A0AA96M1U1_9ENTR|nr:prepilin peptidase-dependent protein [Enterobacter chuandaensis]OQD47536.1 prepilin-type N-terminal cleavage/methylation domain-containing protein [Enterobacter cancerogenus]MCM7589447.1 prepilin peptidase-dependent protein [Enterobacter chuandaensis]MCW4783014.1 prepilin peptidase-dependent protein [Enterobacter chuandaensis]MDA4760218.1 prepilin peptidase-dependent protein [Enterobacter chuandaensis]RJL01376.1 prepilin peptidase-dependent protein [Enterobacter chuandaensis]
MSMKQRGFSLTEVLIATAISSLLLISASRFLPGLQRAVLLQSGQRELEEEVWQRLFALGKQLQRAGYCAGNCQEQGLAIARQGSCIIARWDANSNGRWDRSASENDSTGFRLESGALETLRGAISCDGKGWEKLTDPDRLVITHFLVRKVEHAGFAPELNIELSAIHKGEQGKPYQALYAVTGYNL